MAYGDAQISRPGCSHKEADDKDGNDADALHVLPERFPLQLDRQLHRKRFLQPQWMSPSERTMPSDEASVVQGSPV